MAYEFLGRMLMPGMSDDPFEPLALDPVMDIAPVPGLYVWQKAGAVTLSEPELLDRRTVRFSWSSNLADPTFYVYRNGELAHVTKATEGRFSVDPAEELVIEVTDDPATAPEVSFPGRFTIQWQGVTSSPTVDHYRIEEQVSGAWVTRGRVPELARNYYRWVSRWLEDDTVQNFRVVPVGDNGNDGTVLTFATRMVRNPDVPDVQFTYNGSTAKTVTIAAAS